MQFENYSKETEAQYPRILNKGYHFISDVTFEMKILHLIEEKKETINRILVKLYRYIC